MKRFFLRHKRSLLWGAFAVPFSVLLLFVSRMFPAFAQWYATVIFPVFPATIGRIFSVFPFSVYEMGLYCLALTVLGSLVYLVFAAFRKLEKFDRFFHRFLAGFFVFLPTVLLLFTLSAGINYSRIPFSQVAGYETQDASARELAALCQELAEQAVVYSGEVPLDESGCMTLEKTPHRQLAKKAMQNLGESFPSLKGYYPNPKPVLFSYGMSHLRITGVFSPFTIEANYNRAIPDYEIPFTICHELAHLKGYMREDEAGFIAFLACRESGEPVLGYSGTLTALSYAMNALARTGLQERYGEIYSMLTEPVKNDFRAHNLYWKSFETKAADLSSSLNDVYLKANDQSDGVKSYGRMVDLLLAERRARISKAS